MPSIVVVGAGVVGLSTAVCLQQQLPSAVVTVIADRFTTATTSDGAAGIFRATEAKTPGVHPDRLRKWLRASIHHMHGLLVSPEAAVAGVSLISGYITHNDRKPRPLYADFAYNFWDLTDEELAKLPGPRRRYGWFMSTLLCECRHYLPFLMKRFIDAGGHVKKRRLHSLFELMGSCDVVVNCAGMANKYLIGDTKLNPNRGHMLRVHAPWVKHLMYFGDNCYIIPGMDNVTIGGTRQVGREDTQPKQEDHDLLWKQACEIVPSLQKARILWDWVGIRPIRSPLRVEYEEMVSSDGRIMKVVHNYGHGGEGVSLSWGTAEEAYGLVKDALQSSPILSKL